MKSNKKTTIIDLSRQQSKVVKIYLNDKLPHTNLADYLTKKHPELNVDEIVHKYRLKTEPMPNGLDKESFCERFMLVAIQRLNKQGNEGS